MKTIGIIPARYASTRLPGKPLCLIAGKSMISRVYDRVALAGLDEMYVATDDQRIYDHVISFGGKAIMTSPSIGSGTERCFAAAKELGISPKDIIINIQGDEPFISPSVIQKLVKIFDADEVNIATLYAPVVESSELYDKGIPKLVTDAKGKVLYFSRNLIPCIRDQSGETRASDFPFKKHIGIYGYRYATLEHLASLSETSLERAEKLEQLRWLEHGKIIFAAEVNETGMSVDTPEDLKKAELFALRMVKNQKG